MGSCPFPFLLAFLAPFVLGYSGFATPTTNDILIGMIVVALSFWAIGTRGEEVRQEEMLRAAYAPCGILAETVARCLGEYCATVGLPPVWGRVLLPAFQFGQVLMHAEHWDSALARPMLEIAIRFLRRPEDFPAAFGGFPFCS